MPPIDSRTAKFEWDPILDYQANDPTSGMKGRLAGFIVKKIIKIIPAF